MDNLGRYHYNLYGRNPILQDKLNESYMRYCPQSDNKDNGKTRFFFESLPFIQSTNTLEYKQEGFGIMKGEMEPFWYLKVDRKANFCSIEISNILVHIGLHLDLVQ